MKIKINKVFNKEGTIKIKNNKKEEKTDINEENIHRVDRFLDIIKK